MSIEEILNELNAPYVREGQHHHSRPGWVNLDCPFCGKGSNRFHLGYNIQAKYFHCWKCRGHSAVSVFQALGATSYKAFELWKGIDPGTRVIKRDLAQISLKIPPGLGPLTKAHRAYLLSRGFDPDEIVRIWNVQGLGMAGRLRWRIYIPIYWKGKQVSWTTRAIGDRVSQRYLSAGKDEESVPHKKCIYGIDLCQNSIVICEGPIDAWAVGPGGGATFGTAFTAAQVRKLAEIPRRIICFDSSPDAQRDARELCSQLSIFPGTTHNVILDAKDPGAASPKELRLLRKVAGL